MTDDVLIVGAGPAGSTTALLLARAGRWVTIVERARFPRRKVCGEYLNAGALAALDALGLLDAVRAVGSPLHGTRLVATGAPPVTMTFARPALACARETLDALLLDAALAAGAQLVRGRVEELVFDEGVCAGVRLRDEAGERVERRARLVVGADGIGSVVARKLDLVREGAGRGRYAIGGHYTGFSALDGHVEMYVGGGAYFALNPLDARRTNVMVVVPKARLSRWSTDVDGGIGGVAAALGRGVRSFAGAERDGGRVSIGPLVHAVGTPTAPGALLVGDAAGFLDPFTGQGVFLALAGARRVAQAIIDGDHGAYARWHADELRPRRRLCGIVKLLVEIPPLARHAAARLARFPEVGATLLDALGGVIPPERALRPAVLGKLLA